MGHRTTRPIGRYRRSAASALLVTEAATAALFIASRWGPIGYRGPSWSLSVTCGDLALLRFPEGTPLKRGLFREPTTPQLNLWHWTWNSPTPGWFFVGGPAWLLPLVCTAATFALLRSASRARAAGLHLRPKGV